MIEERAWQNRPRLFRSLPVLTFYLLAFGVSWLGFVPALAESAGVSFFQSSWWKGTLIFPAIGPALAAWIASALYPPSEQGSETSWRRLKTSFLRPVAFRWWMTTILLAVGIMLAAKVLSFEVGHVRVVSRATASGVLLFSALSLAANPLEEIGWRGFAQIRLEERHSASTASVIVGVLWAIWHVPLFLFSGSPMSMAQTSFWVWAAGVVPQAILLAWLYHRTGHSLAVVSVCHVLGNISAAVLQPSTSMVSAVRIAAALVVFWKWGPSLGQPQGSSAEDLSDRS